jgi:predicted dehydrogenase
MERNVMKDNKLRVGVVGGGNISRRLHLPTWMKIADVELVAIADPSEAAIDSARLITGLAPADTYRDPRQLLSRDDIDIVDICTPPAIRSALIIEAAARGKHVFAEKPLASTPAQAAAAVDAADNAGVIFAMGHNYLVLDEIRAVREVIRSGEIGEVRTATVNYLGVEYVPGQAGDWRRDPALSGGGVLMDIVHAIYVLEAFLGEPIIRASAWVDSIDPESHVEDLALCRFETDRKAGMVNIGWGFGDGHIDVAGTHGRVSIQYRDGGTAPWAPLEKVTVTTTSGTRTVLGPEESRPATYDEFPPIAKTFHLLVEDFVAAVRDGRPPLATGADGLRALEAAVAAYASAATQTVVDIPLHRQGSAFLRGTTGVPMLPRPQSSPLNRLALFSAVSES